MCGVGELSRDQGGAGQLHDHPGAAGGRSRRRATVPEWRSVTWRTIDRPRPEPGIERDSVGAVEPLEDVRQVVPRRCPAPRRRRSACRRLSRTVTRAAGRAPLRGVVEQVGHRALERRPTRRSTHHGSVSTSNVRPVRAAADPGHRPVDDLGQVDLLDDGASAARRGPARRGRRPAWSAPRSGRRTSSSSSAARLGSRPPAASAWSSRSRLVRSEVSGVRSSWPASATSWRCRSRDADSAASIALNAVASRAISSSPSTGSGVEVLGAGDRPRRCG